ncbi:MAG: type II toxin-antitoxin system VapC family toxin [Deltaproteobacteria bacterium]|nr:type II toxin-antitoxin system VapC family toxin [Deltaproteobacteria bacterium]
MKLLLDTHVWLWQLAQPELLSRRASAALEDLANELYLSPISVWEVLVLARKGCIQLSSEPVEWVREALRKSPAQMAELTHDIALGSEDLPGLASRDPADRFLVATCLDGEMTLVTADRALRRYRRLRTLW